VSERLAIRAHFDRFPASVKGAFVLRGGDGNPHQVVFREVRVAQIGGRAVPFGFEQVTLEIAPTLDLFVPYEVPLADLGPGWYTLECDLLIDAEPEVVRPTARFCVPWPRATVRRGSVTVGKRVKAGEGAVALGSVTCAADHATLDFEAPAPPRISVAAGGTPVIELETGFDEETGKGSLTLYPLMKSDRQLSITVKGADPVTVKLP
jgi:hypothetical protein